MLRLNRLVFICLLLLVNQSAFAGFNPKTPFYKEIAPILGTWGGQVFGKTFEIALWPNNHFNHVSGVMIWGDCKSVIQLSYIMSEALALQGITKANPGLAKQAYVFSMVSRVRFVKFRNSSCPAKGYPGYSSLFLSTDEAYSALTVYSKDEAKWPKLKRQPGTMLRQKPSRQMADAINKLDKKHEYKLSAIARALVFDPTKKYQSQAKETGPRKVRAGDIPGQPGKVLSKPDQYWWETYRYSAYQQRRGRKSSSGDLTDDFPRLLEQVFNGKDRLRKTDMALNGYYVQLIKANQDACAAQLDKEGYAVVRLRADDYKKDRYGNRYNESTSYSQSVRVRKRFVDSYKKALGWTGVSQQINYDRFHEMLKKEGCSSQVVNQLFENFHRMVLDKKTIQEVAGDIGKGQFIFPE